MKGTVLSCASGKLSSWFSLVAEYRSTMCNVFRDTCEPVPGANVGTLDGWVDALSITATLCRFPVHLSLRGGR